MQHVKQNLGIKNENVRTESGVTLIELMVVITIMGIMMSIATLSFNSWQVKSNIESQTRKMFTDVSEARTNAFTQKKYYGIVFQPSSYVMKTYSSEVEFNTTTAAAANGTAVASENLKYGLTKAGADITDTPMIFNTSGLGTGFNRLGFTIYVNPTSASASVNCLVISSARVNMGKVNGSSCDFK